jgi:hypothetical protein
MKPTPLTVVLNKQLVSNFLEVMPFWLSALHKRFHASADGRSYAAIFSDQDSLADLMQRSSAIKIPFRIFRA